MVLNLVSMKITHHNINEVENQFNEIGLIKGKGESHI